MTTNYNFIDIKGRRFDLLLVIDRAGISKDRKTKWRCLCDCGNEFIAIGKKLRTGRTKSCGCLRHVAMKAGLGSNTRIYRIWKGMRGRCYNRRDKDFKYYGGRGITICELWQQYKPFHDWALSHGYADNLTIDRIDNDLNYTPENCEWITQKENTIKRHKERLPQPHRPS